MALVASASDGNAGIEMDHQDGGELIMESSSEDHHNGYHHHYEEDNISGGAGGIIQIDADYNNNMPGTSPVSANNLYSPFTYPLMEARTSGGAFMGPGYGKSPEFVTRLPRESPAQIGFPAALECQIDGNPLPDIMWTKDDDDITESEDPNYSFELDAIAGLCRLTIEKFRESDKGVYRCILENCYGACSSTTTVKISDKQVNTSADRSQKHQGVASADHGNASTSSSSTSHHPSQPQVNLLRELTTISEHLSQEDGGSINMFSMSMASDSHPEEQQQLTASSSNLTRHHGIDDIMEASSTTITNMSATPLDISLTDSWNEESVNSNSNREELGSPDSAGSGTVRTVVNFDPTHLRQFSITPVQHSCDSSEDQNLAEDVIERGVAANHVYADVEAQPQSDLPLSISIGQNDNQLRSATPPIVAVEEPTPPYGRRQLLIRIDGRNIDEDDSGAEYVEKHIGSTDTAEHQQNRSIGDLALSEPAIIENISSNHTAVDHHGDSNYITMADEKPTVHYQEDLSPNSATNLSFNNCSQEPSSANISIGSSQLSLNGPAFVPIYRTMSSPSSVPSQRRRSSFLDYFIDNDPKTRRRTIIMQCLIALQITFLAFLAINWQEYLVDSLMGSGQEVAPVMQTKVTATKAAKAAKAVASLAHAHSQQQQRHQGSPVSHFAVMTTPLSFIFVLAISSLATFIFANSVQI